MMMRGSLESRSLECVCETTVGNRLERDGCRKWPGRVSWKIVEGFG